MNWKVNRRRGVGPDIAGIADYLRREDELLAIRFIDSTEQTIEKLATMPEVGSPKSFAAPALAGLRSWRIIGFPKHLIFYRITGRTIHVLAVVHGARDLPRFLGKRLK